MRHSAVWFCIFTLLFVVILGNVSGSDEPTLSFPGGTGTPGDPYLITNVIELQAMGTLPSSHFALDNDIDASATSSWNSGEGFVPVNSFTGSLDGRNHTVTGLFINRSTLNYQGLFGTHGSGTVKNVIFKGSFIKGHYHVGGIWGMTTGQILNCHFRGEVSGRGYVGGIAGHSSVGILSDCTADLDATGTSEIGGIVGLNLLGLVERSNSSGNVRGIGAIGGLVGSNNKGEVFNSSSSAIVTGSSSIGGIAGWITQYGIISGCVSTGDVNGSRNVGGIVGVLDGSDCRINSSHSSGNVTATSEVGGIVGTTFGTIKNSHFTGNVSGTSNTGGIVGDQWTGSMENCHYNIDDVEINGLHRISTGGIFDAQYRDWNTSNMDLDISDYSSTLVPSGDMYVISSVQGMKDLLGFSQDPTLKYRLGNDLDLSSEPGLFIPHLSGDLDGNNMTISGLDLNLSYHRFSGLIGVMYDCRVKDLLIEDVQVRGNTNVGGLCGYSKNTEIENCHVTGSVLATVENAGMILGGGEYLRINNSSGNGSVSGEAYIGGISAYINYGSVENTSFSGDVRSIDHGAGISSTVYQGSIKGSNSEGSIQVNGNAGGIAGQIYLSEISFCWSSMDIAGENGLGGLIGVLNGNIVSDCYSTGEVTRIAGEGTWVGGFAGVISGKVVNCYSTGKVSYLNATNPTNKGFAGRIFTNPGYLVEGCFFDIDTSGQFTSEGEARGMPTEYLQDKFVYISEGWDFADVWGIKVGHTYPFFRGSMWNDDPVAVDDHYSINEREVLVVDGVLVNDVDSDLDIWPLDLAPSEPLGVTGHDNVSLLGASVEVSENGTVEYQPYTSPRIMSLSSGEMVTDSFRYTIGDGNGGFDNAMVFVEVTGFNEAPVAGELFFDITEDQYLPFGSPYLLMGSLDGDGDDLIVFEETVYGKKGAQVEIIKNGSFSYNPRGGFNFLSQGELFVDEFTYTVMDENGAVSVGTVHMNVTGENDDPTLSTSPDIIYYLSEGAYFQLDFQADDRDGDVLSWEVVGDADWLHIDADNGMLTGIPVIGHFLVGVWVTDMHGGKDITGFEIQVDPDGDRDGIPDKNDDDDDNDGASDELEILVGTYPWDNSSVPPDTDGDGIFDVVDEDDDGDLFSDQIEVLLGTDPLDHLSYPRDSDGDGEMDIVDEDDDNDGWSDVIEELAGTDPLNANSYPIDTDGDGIADFMDPDQQGSEKIIYNNNTIYNNSTPDDDDDDDSDEGGISSGFMMFAFLWVILLIAVVMVFFVMFRKRKVEDEEVPFETGNSYKKEDLVEE